MILCGTMPKIYYNWVDHNSDRRNCSKWGRCQEWSEWGGCRGECIAEGPFGRAIHSSFSLSREFVGNVGAMNQENTLRNGNEICAVVNDLLPFPRNIGKIIIWMSRLINYALYLFPMFVFRCRSNIVKTSCACVLDTMYFSSLNKFKVHHVILLIDNHTIFLTLIKWKL